MCSSKICIISGNDTKARAQLSRGLSDTQELVEVVDGGAVDWGRCQRGRKGHGRGSGSSQAATEDHLAGGDGKPALYRWTWVLVWIPGPQFRSYLTLGKLDGQMAGGGGG